MVTRNYMNSTTVGDIDGDAYMDDVAAKGDVLFSNMTLVPTVITNSGNDFTMTLDPALKTGTDVTAGMGFYIQPNANGTGPVRLRATASNPFYDVVKATGEALADGDWQSDTVYFVVFIGGDFRILSASQTADAGGATFYDQTFTVGGTWIKPLDLDPNAWIDVEIWAGGGGGANNSDTGGGGGGGGCYNYKRFKPSDLTASVAVTVGAGGAIAAAGGNSSFGSYLTAFGGGAGSGTSGSTGGFAGGGGGSTGAGGNAGASNGIGGTGGILGSPGGSASVSSNRWGGAGGGFGSNTPIPGGANEFGGGGGGGGSDGAAGGVSAHGGNGGAAEGAAAQVPGGGGGRFRAGAAGLCRIRIIG